MHILRMPCSHQKYCLVLMFILLTSSTLAQTTFSPYEESMARYVNNSLAYARKYDSLQRIQPALDSCVRFLEAYPNSFVKPNVFTYMLQMSALITRDTTKIFPLMDSVLAYDTLPTTLMSIGQLLIEKDIHPDRGVLYLNQALPHLTFKYHRYLSNLLLSKVELSRGFLTAARHHIMEAVRIDSTRLDAWYAYLGYCRMQEDSEGESIAALNISRLLSHSHREYVNYLDDNRFIGKSIYGLRGPDLDGNTISFSQFEGTVTVIQIFNFWCAVPGKEFPTIKRLTDKFPRVRFVFLNSGETAEELRQRYFTRPESRFIKDHVIVFSDSSMLGFFEGSMDMGEILLIDKLGKVRYAFPGMTKNFDAMLETKIHELLNEP
jgi:hypothetical protein